MDEASYDVPGARRGGRGTAAGRRLWGWLLAGLALGLAGGFLLPGLLGPYLPGFLGGGTERIEGQVLSKQRVDDRLLLTVEANRGAVLATFRERVDELALLVSEGDSITLRVGEFRPFVENPTVLAVRKFPGSGRRAGGRMEGAESGAGMPAGEAASPGGTPPSGGSPAGADTAGTGGS